METINKWQVRKEKKAVLNNSRTRSTKAAAHEHKWQARKEKKAVLNNSRTRSTKAAAHEQYTAANRAVKKSVKTDKVNFIDSLAKEVEDAAAGGNMKQLYGTARKPAGNFKQAEWHIKDKNWVKTKWGDGEITLKSC